GFHRRGELRHGARLVRKLFAVHHLGKVSLMPLRSLIDHLVVTAPDLDTGAAWVKSLLGVEPVPGGGHAAMGTHNRLLKLGPSSYLEVIAVNPAAPAPTRPRWFALDELEPGEPPRLATWVVRTTDIEAAQAASP